MRVGFDLFGRGQLFKPREGDAIFLELNADVLDAEGLFDQLAFGIQQFGEVSDRDLFERDLNRKACLFGFGLVFDRVESGCGKGDDDRLNGVLIRALVPDHRAVFLNGDVVDDEGAGGHEFVDGLHADHLGDDADQFFAVLPGDVVV